MSEQINVIDYGMGNIKSVKNAFNFLGVETKVVRSPKDLDTSKRLIIPGVGAFGDAMRNLEEFVPVIEETIENGESVLGICLGMQVLFEESEEFERVEGLGVLKGKVTKIDTELQLPHIGWNSLNIRNDGGPLFDGIDDGYVYYVHSYHCESEESVVMATSEYGEEITASVWEENLFGTQFHPEKSGKLGLKILKNFTEL